MLAFSGHVSAEMQIDHATSLIADTQYNSNLQFLPIDAESVYVYRIMPTYKIRAADSIDELFATIGFNFQKSSNNTISNDREDPNATVGWVRTLPSGSLSLGASYLKESNRILQFTQTGLVADDGTSVTRDFDAIWTHNLTNRLEMELSARYQKTVFSGVNALGNFDDRRLQANFEYQYSQTLTPFIRLSANDLRNVSRTKYQTAVFGSQIDFGTPVKYLVELGNVHFSSSGDDEAVGAFEIDYESARQKLLLRLSREAFPTGLDFVEIGDAIALSYLYDISEKSQFGSSLNASQTKIGAFKTQSVTFFYNYDLSPKWQMNVDLGFNNIKTPGSNSANNNVLGVGLTYQSLNF